MTDIESRMEANGYAERNPATFAPLLTHDSLPKKFDSTSDKSAEDHSTANLVATMSNAEAVPMTDLKSSTPVAPETSDSIQHPERTEVSVVPDSQPMANDLDVPRVNGSTSLEAPPVTNGHSASPVPESAPSANAQSVTSIDNDSMVPSSIPAEISSSFATSNLSQPSPGLMPPQPAAQPDATISDLRTSPHADALTPDAVAKVEEHKHAIDNAAAALEAPTQAAIAAPAVSDALIKSDNALPTPPIQSPPPAPEPAHAVLPTEALKESVIPPPLAQEMPLDPAPTPVAPAVTAQDTPMEDAPALKMAREREDDPDMDEPAAKRVRTDDNSPVSDSGDFKIPDAPAAGAGTGQALASGNILADGDDSVTIPRLNHMKKVISNLKKSNASTAFRLPVDAVTLNIPTYPQIVKTPMDLGTIDSKLKNNSYATVSDFITDFELIVNNCILFNGKEHGITQQAYKMQSSFNNQMAHLPPAAMQEPTKAEKKAMKLKTEPVRQTIPRRPSVTTPGSARSPKSAAPVSTPSFAPGPDGVPLIRRDSSLQSDRPKRAIVPPKRNSDFAGVRPKKKKYELQLRFCQEVLKEISSSKHWQINQYFTHPVDPVALNIPTYFQIIKKPMDLGTIQTKLDSNQYEKAKDFEEDVRLIFKNCYKFNPEGDFVNQKGHELEELFDSKWATKDDWIAAREPHSEPSEVEDAEDEEEASEEEDNDSEDERNEKIKALQAQIEAMSKQMGELTQVKKKKKTPPTVSKKGSKSKPKKEKASATFPGLTKKGSKKASASKPKEPKDRYVTFAEKQYISNGIAMLPERQMQEALKIIQNSVPSLANSDQNEIELDIEEVPNHALLKLLNFVKKYAGPPPDEPEARAAESYAPPAVERSKKSKPMSKTEQEAQIAELKGKLGTFGGPVSPDAVQSVETGGDSSDESADSEESEEE